MTDSQKVEKLRDLVSDILHAYDMTVYDMEDPEARAIVVKWSDVFFDRMLAIVND
jgi:hypothetical protein